MLKTARLTALLLIFLLNVVTPSLFAASRVKQNKTATIHTSDQNTVSTPAQEDANENTAENSPSPKFQREQQFSKLTQSQDDPKAAVKLTSIFHIGGLVNVDLSHQTHSLFSDDDKTDISISALQLNAEAFPTTWLQAHIGFFYAGDPDDYYATSTHKRQPEINTAYLTFADLNTCPLYVRLGEQYVPFGRYKHYPIIKPLTQALAETRQSAFEAGFISLKGLYGAIYTFNGTDSIQHNKSHALNNFGATINYKVFTGPMGFDIGTDYLYNMIDVGTINYTLPHNTYQTKVDGLALHLNIFSGPFDYQIQYVKALGHFARQDINFSPHINEIRGAKPSAGMVKAGYSFKTAEKDSKIILGYEWSQEASNIRTDTLQYFPLNRIAASYGINLIKNTILVFKIARDRDYPKKNGGTNKINYTGAVRVTVLLK